MTTKRALWYAVISVRAGDGMPRERRWSKGFTTKRDAERELAQMLIAERTAKRTKTTIGSILRAYIDNDRTPRGPRSPTTTQGYEYLFGKLHRLHDQRADSIEAATIERCYTELRASGLSETTIHHAHNLLFASLKWAAKRSIALISHNPFQNNDDIERPRRCPSNARAYTREQARKALWYLSHTKHANAIIFAFATACRRGEVCGLKWNCVDLERGVVLIQESRYQTRQAQGQKPPKSHRIREIPLNHNALTALENERARQDERRGFAGDAWIASDFVFTDELGRPLSPMALTNAFGRCARQAGLPSTRMHDLRHTAATFILSAGKNPVALSKILGHSDKATTLRMYGHVIDADSVDAIASIDTALEIRDVHGLKFKRKRRI